MTRLAELRVHRVPSPLVLPKPVDGLRSLVLEAGR